MPYINRHDAFGAVFDDLLKGIFTGPSENGAPARRMRIDLSERDGEYRLIAELPGLKKEDVNVQIEGDRVSITAEARDPENASQAERLLHGERHFGALARAFRLGEEVDESRAVAKLADGVLELTLPKKSPAASRKVTVQ
jgi:HSP20 family protein